MKYLLEAGEVAYCPHGTASHFRVLMLAFALSITYQAALHFFTNSG